MNSGWWVGASFLAVMVPALHFSFTVARRSATDDELVWDEDDYFEPGHRPTLASVSMRPNRRYHDLRAGGYTVGALVAVALLAAELSSGAAEPAVLAFTLIPMGLAGWAWWYRSRTVSSEEMVRIDNSLLMDNRDGRSIPIHRLERVVVERHPVTADVIHFVTRDGSVAVDLRDVDLAAWAGDVDALLEAVRSVIPAPGSRRPPVAPIDLTYVERVFPWRRLPVAGYGAGFVGTAVGLVWTARHGWLDSFVSVPAAMLFGTLGLSLVPRLLAAERLGARLSGGRLHVLRSVLPVRRVIATDELVDVIRLRGGAYLRLRDGRPVHIATGLLRDGDELVSLLQRAVDSR